MKVTQKKKFQYSSLDLPALAKRYKGGDSLRELARSIGRPGCHKVLGKYLREHVEAIGGEMRSQAKSQSNRRALELSVKDVTSWYDPFLGRIRGS